MSEQIKLTHPEYDDLTVTVSTATEETWAEAFPDLMNARRKPTAYYNTLVSCLVKPSVAELGPIVNEWTGLPETAFWRIAMKSGHLNVTSLDDLRGKNEEERAELLDGDNAFEVNLDAPWQYQEGEKPDAEREAQRAFLRELDSAIPGRAEGDKRSPEERAAEHVAGWIAQYPRKRKNGLRGKIRALRTPWGIIVIGAVGRDAILRQTSVIGTSDLYMATRKLILTAAIHPTADVLAVTLTKRPALVGSLGTIVKEISDVNAKAVVGEG